MSIFNDQVNQRGKNIFFLVLKIPKDDYIYLVLNYFTKTFYIDLQINQVGGHFFQLKSIKFVIKNPQVIICGHKPSEGFREYRKVAYCAVFALTEDDSLVPFTAKKHLHGRYVR